MLTLALIASLFGQVGDCGPGKDCKSQSFQSSPCVATSALPTCNAARVGTLKCDSTQGCIVACFSSAWSCVATAASTSDTCTGGTCRIGAAGIATDGGIISTAGDIQQLSGFMRADGYASPTGKAFRFSGNTCIIQDNTAFAMLTCDGATRICNAGQALTSTTYVEATTHLRSIGVATASLPTCNAAAEGQIQTDTTIDRPVFCDGSKHLWPVGNIAGFYPGQATVTPADNVTIANQRLYSGGNIQRIGVASLLAGTAAGAETYTVDVYNNTTATVLCTKAAVACTTASISSADCANVAYAASDDIRIRVHCSTCTTCPMLMVNAEYQ